MDEEYEGEDKDFFEVSGEVNGEGEDEDEEPPPEPQDKELLFLIEFLVDTLTLFPENMNLSGIDPCALQGPTAVVLTFLHFPPMSLGEKDTDPNRRTGSNVVQYNSGKSLMFALTEAQFEEPPPIYLHIAAAREMPHAFRFQQLSIGQTKVQLSELFKQVFEKYDEHPKTTVSKSIKDCYLLTGEDNKPTAEMTLYIRLTCLGENVVTEFQKTEDPEEPMLFKNRESKKVYECRESEQQEESKGMNIGGDGKKSCEQSMYAPPPDPDDENYEEIFAQINGSSIAVKVEKSKRKDPPKPFHVSEFCDCDIPLPHDLVAGMSDLSLSRVSEGSINFPVRESPASPGGKPGGAGEPIDKRVALDDANQLIFNVPPIETMTQPGGRNTLVYNVNTCHDNEKHKHKAGTSYKVITDNNPDGPPPKMPNDPEKDVFILRIIKRGKSNTGKGTLSLEFKTPKEKIELPKRKPYYVEAGCGPEKSKKK
ncbi:hypothetical protein RUM43_002633 [Polyplax serrata]|uniref:Uncharacterized protein n=1 Tax=Polyplax serrata TaxID=468196 RepID=A0AAN8PE71_POLSC